MAICPNGTEPKPATPSIIVAAGAFVASLLTEQWELFGPFASVLAPVVVDSGVLCNGDPEPWPDFTSADFVGLATGAPSPKVQQAIRHLLWYQFCQCKGAPTPPRPTPPPPADVPTFIPGPALPCSSVHLQHTQGPDQFAKDPLIGTAQAPVPLPGGATQVNLTTAVVTALNVPNGAGDYVFFVNFTDANDVWKYAQSIRVYYYQGDFFGSTLEFAIDPTWKGYYATCQVSNPPTADQAAGDVMSLDLIFYCGDQQGTGETNCCPPDPTLVAKIDFLRSQIELILTRLGEAGPLAHLASRAISGEGQIALEPGARQVNIQLEQLGTGTSMVPYAYPDRVMRAGTVRFGNAFGWRRREHVDNTDCLFVVPADSTVVSWSLSPGTTGLLLQLGATPESASL